MPDRSEIGPYLGSSLGDILGAHHRVGILKATLSEVRTFVAGDGIQKSSPPEHLEAVGDEG